MFNEVIIIGKLAKEPIIKEKVVQKDVFTKDEYLIMAKVLKEQKEKIRAQREKSKIEELQEMYRSVK